MSSLLDSLQTVVADEATVRFWVTALAAASALLSGVETLAARGMFREDGALAWSVQRHRYKELSGIGFPATYPAVLAFPALRALAAAGLLVLLWRREPFGPLHSMAVVVIALSYFATMARQPQASGAESMEGLVWFGLVFAWLQPENMLATRLALWFIALQSILSYCSNGWHKAFIPAWRKGDVLPLFAHHPVFGHPLLARLADRGMRLHFVMSSVIVLETAFPLVLVTGMPGCLLFVGWAATFHILNGVLMGLNAFILAYFCTYPAILFCSASVQSAWSSWLS